MEDLDEFFDANLPDSVRLQLMKMLAKKDEELARKDEEQARKDEELANYRACSIQKLLEDGLIGLRLIRQQNFLATHTSSHNSIDYFQEKHFHVIDTIDGQNLSTTSIFLLQLQKLENKKNIVYSNEPQIEAHVRNLLQDVLTLLGIDRKVVLDYQTRLIYKMENSSMESRSDIWVVKSRSGVPISLVEVKQPGNSKLSNSHVLGQMFDYMSNLRNSFGQCEVFGIVTTLDQWRVVWFPDTDAFAASEDLHPPKFEDSIVQFPVESTLQRSLSCSKEYSWDDALLFKLIATVLLKSMRAHYRVVPLLSSRRAYPILSTDKWHWSNISQVVLNTYPNIRLTLPQLEPTHLIVLRQFHGGADGQVCLALTEDFHLVVLKKFYSADVCKREYNMWKAAYGVDVLITKIVGSHSLIMPFVFHCIERGGNIVFEFDMSYWGRGEESSVLDDERFNDWTTKFVDYMAESEEYTVKKALTNAVDSLSEKKLVHRDIEWRHVALMPMFDSSSGNSETVVDMKPVLIDMASVTTVETIESAREQMQDKVNELVRSLA